MITFSKLLLILLTMLISDVLHMIDELMAMLHSKLVIMTSELPERIYDLAMMFLAFFLSMAT